MAANLTTAESILKEFYVAPIQEQLNQEVLAFQLFESESVEWQGRVAVVPLHISRNTGVGFRAEGQPLPTASAQGYARLEVPATFGYGHFQFTGQAMDFSDTDRGAFEPVVTAEMKRLVEDVRILLDKACYYGGPVIGFAWQKQNGATWQYSGRVDNTLDTSFGVEVGVGQTIGLYSLRTYLQIGVDTQVNSINDTTMVLNGAINGAVGALDVGGNAIVAGDVFAVVHNSSNRAVEFHGMNSNLGQKTWYNIDRSLAANAQTRSNFLLADFNQAAPVYQDLSLDAMQILLDKIMLKSNSQPDRMILSPVHRQSYTTLLQGTLGANVRVIMDGEGAKKKTDAGLLNLGYSDIPFMTSQNCPKGSIYMINKKYWGTFQRRPGDFSQIDGRVLRMIPGFDVAEGYWKYYANLVCKRPNASGVLTGVTYFGV